MGTICIGSTDEYWAAKKSTRAPLGASLPPIHSTTSATLQQCFRESFGTQKIKFYLAERIRKANYVDIKKPQRYQMYAFGEKRANSLEHHSKFSTTGLNPPFQHFSTLLPKFSTLLQPHWVASAPHVLRHRTFFHLGYCSFHIHLPLGHLPSTLPTQLLHPETHSSASIIP